YNTKIVHIPLCSTQQQSKCKPTIFRVQGENKVARETVLSFKEDSRSSNCSSQFLNQWNVMYKSDAENVVADPINTKDLLSWSYQVAMGMDYLSKRKAAWVALEL
ncbi:hypothetical protein J437_LFUL019106, partial [Ladona fulva]